MSLYKNMNALYEAGGSQFSTDASRRRSEKMADARAKMAWAEGHDTVSPLQICGEHATALVLDARPTGRMLDRVPEIAFELLVSRRGQSPYPLAITQAVPQPYLLKVRPGAELMAKVDPGNPRSVFLDFGRS